MIEIQSLSRRFGKTVAVDDVSMTVEAGEMVALVGTSGSGKTTLLRMLNRLVEPSAGRVLLNGTDTGTLKAHELRRRIGYAIQGHGLFPHYTVAQNIAIVPELLHWPKDRVREKVDALLTLLGLPPGDFRGRYPSALSGGQQQRVGVARALAAEPEVLLMDEPFGALDPVTRARAQADLRAVQARLGTTTVIVTHDMDEAIALGSRIAVMDRGRLVQYDTPSRLLTHPATDFVARLTGRGERPFRLLAVSRVGDHLEPGGAEGAPIDAEASAREALSECLWSGRDALPVMRDGTLAGRVTLANLRSTARGAGMIARVLAVAFLAVMLIRPETLAPIFAPLTRNGAPPIYTQSSLLDLTISHLSLVAAAVAASTVVAVALAVLVTRPAGAEFRPLARTITQVGQTLPPVAVLALAVPMMGFGAGPTLIALFLYGLLPIFENTVTALSTLPPPVTEAARAVGYTGAQRLWRVELPLSLPIILAGIRLTTVISLSTATIGSAVAAHTLGEVIIAGLLSNNSAFVVQGGLMVGLIAMLLHDAFTALERRATRG